jgi:hypothetical protein
MLQFLFAFFFMAATQDPDIGRDMISIVKSKGYNIEAHSVTTEDGYILGMFRIPRPGAPAVLLQHGLLGECNVHTISKEKTAVGLGWLTSRPRVWAILFMTLDTTFGLATAEETSIHYTM